MDWLPFALLAPVIMTLINFGDKFLMERHIPAADAMLLYLTWSSFLISFTLFLLMGLPTLDTQDALILMLSGCFNVGGNFFYLRALSQEDTSTITVLLQLVPVVTLILSVIFLQEVPTGIQLAGFVCIIIAATGISRKKKALEIDATQSLLLIAAGAVFWGLSVILADTVLGYLVVDLRSLFVATIHVSMGYFPALVLIYLLQPAMRRSFHQSVAKTRFAPLPVLMTIQISFLFRQAALFMAMSLGPVALVTVLGGTGVFFGIVLGVLFTLLFPAIYREDTSRAELQRKMQWAVLMFVGIILLSVT